MPTRNKTSRNDQSTARPPGASPARPRGSKTAPRPAESRNRRRRPGESRPEQSQPQAADRSPEASRKSDPDQPSTPPGRVAALGRGIASAAQTAAQTVTGASATAARSVTANPIPAALVGAGVAWLLVQNLNRRTRFIERTKDALTDRFAEPLSSAVETVTEKLSDTADTVRQGVSGAAESVREGATQVGQYARNGATAVTGALRTGAAAVGQGAQRALTSSRDAVAKTWQDYPLAMGLFTLAAGVTAGLLLPRSDREAKMMGRASADLAEKVRTTGRDLVQKGKKAASSAATATAREAHRVGLAPDEIGRKIKRIVTSAKDAITTESAD